MADPRDPVDEWLDALGGRGSEHAHGPERRLRERVLKRFEASRDELADDVILQGRFRLQSQLRRLARQRSWRRVQPWITGLAAGVFGFVLIGQFVAPPALIGTSKAPTGEAGADSRLNLFVAEDVHAKSRELLSLLEEARADFSVRHVDDTVQVTFDLPAGASAVRSWLTTNGVAPPAAATRIEVTVRPSA